MIDLKDTLARAAVPATVAGILAIGAFLWSSASTTVSRLFELPYAQKVRWIEGERPGMQYWDASEARSGVTYIPWADLDPQLRASLLPSLSKYPSNYRFEPQNFGNHVNRVIKILDADAKSVGWLWLGGNPETGFGFDGLVRIGGDHRAERVWQVYQRYSDGSYRRISSIFANIEDACPPNDRPCTKGN